MSTQTPPVTPVRRRGPGPAALVGGWLLCGAAGGLAVDVLAFLLARYGPAGAGWSFRGNGALAAYALVPALLAGGWTAAVLRHRGRPRWAVTGVYAGLVGVALAIADALLIPVFGTSGDRAAGPVLVLALAAWTVVAPALAARARALAARDRHRLAVSLAGALGWLVGIAAGLMLGSTALPPGS